MSELTKRIIVATVGIPFAFFVVYLGGIAFNIVIALIASLALKEFYDIAEKKGYPTFKIWGIFLGLIPFALSLVGHFYQESLSFLLAIPVITSISLILLVFGTLFLVLFSKRQNSIASIGTMLTGFFYISCSFFTLVLLRNSNFGDNENFRLFVVIIMFCSIWICDSAAYFIGRKFGKRKLLERVSPKKTIEGAIAGFIASTIFFPLAAIFLLPDFNFIYSLLLGLIVGIFGQVGDLIESKLKRDADVKDSSNLIPGHGGILDRFDSIIFVSPLVTMFLVILHF